MEKMVNTILKTFKWIKFCIVRYEENMELSVLVLKFFESQLFEINTDLNQI